MKRSLANLEDSVHDVLVIGGGIYGACIAWEATSRGLSAALVDRGDFGGATSDNSLSLVHGGLRYLQHLGFSRMRSSARERRFWLNNAPHLVRPLKFVMPLYGHLTRGPEALLAAVKIHEAMTRDCERGVPSENRIPPGCVVSKSKCLALVPGIREAGLTGAAIWYEGQVQDSHRLLLEVVNAAVLGGATVANYVAVEDGIVREGRVEGVRARDLMSQREIEIRARVIVNATGPWIGSLFDRLTGCGATKLFGELSKGMNLVTRHFFDGYAVGVASRRASDSLIPRGGRLYFITPWRNCAVIGTSHLPYPGKPDDYLFTDDEIVGFLNEINDAYPPARLTRDDVLYCYSGLTPAHEGTVRGELKRARRGAILDHEKVHGLKGLVSVLGVKFTTARLAGEQAVDIVFDKLGEKLVPSVTATTPLPGAKEFRSISEWQRDAAARLGSAADKVAVLELLEAHGSAYGCVIERGKIGPDADFEEIWRGRCRYAVREEMAMRLSDILFRRTDVAVRGEMTAPMLAWSADMMAEEMGWSEQRKQDELDDVRDLIGRHRGVPTFDEPPETTESHGDRVLRPSTA
ncbi:MAG: glycerol-3-phosphate dehydrogenase/oxidase [Proteobacteria bacterium]|nr:glycerol-3-phosphate dehydrogenase/oxidase [Pseudomonadota bacterium]